MREQLKNLARLQEIDDQLAMLERSKGDYPERIEELESGLKERLGGVADVQQTQEELQKEQRGLDRKIADRKQQLEKFQGHLADVKTNKEWDALQKELDAVKSDIGEAEDRLLEVVVSLEELSSTTETEEEELSSYRSQAEAEIGDLKEKLGSVDSKMAKIRNERDALSIQIEERLKRIYNRVKQGKQGTAVVPVVRDACGGCYTRIPPQTVTEIRRAERPITCENCGRILVWYDEEEAS
jgi:predicted  nucleic acid-binding Zn-ribbon protein